MGGGGLRRDGFITGPYLLRYVELASHEGTRGRAREQEANVTFDTVVTIGALRAGLVTAAFEGEALARPRLRTRQRRCPGLRAPALSVGSVSRGSVADAVAVLVLPPAAAGAGRV